MADDLKKNTGEQSGNKPGQQGQTGNRPGEESDPQQKNREDISKRNPSHQGEEDEQNDQQQGGQRRAS